MFKYYTDSNRPKVKTQKVGTKIEPIYKERIDEKGNKILKVVGKTNVFERAQADKDLCNINLTMEKYGITAVDSVRKFLSQNDVEFIDEEFLDMTIMERQNKMLELEEQFNNLDSSIKSYFGNNFRKFYSSVVNKTIVDDFRNINSKLVPQKESVLVPQKESVLVPQKESSVNNVGGDSDAK